ncbi:reticulocyte-binding protein homolog 2a-like [Uloborus diversus]|uniref:reticulocyte-binding protein homolog 2a-like n=1 Tax=Uloborus diversus TaxID=327109 RepID=UPI002409DEA5|nr:reticulocyte-binding protein homolog 2a-like [Uloborus diversus]
MSYLSKVRKRDLQYIATELGEDDVKNLTVIRLIKVILSNDNYEEEIVKGIISSLDVERLSEEEREKRQHENEQRQQEIESEKRQHENELRQQEIEREKRQQEIEREKRQQEIEREKRQQEIEREKRQHENEQRQQEIEKLQRQQEFEREQLQYQKEIEREKRQNEIEREKRQHELQLQKLESEAKTSKPEKNAEDFAYVKDLLLKRYKLSPEKFRQLFYSHKDGKSWREYYYDRRTTTDEEKYHSSRLELLAVVWSVNRLRPLLLDLRFTLVTDCSAVAYLNSQRNIKPQIARWAEQLSEYDYEVKQRPGSQMLHVDALSRAPIENADDENQCRQDKGKDNQSEPIVLYIATEEDKVALIQSQDEELQAIIEMLKNPKLNKQKNLDAKFELINGILYHVPVVDGKKRKQFLLI